MTDSSLKEQDDIAAIGSQASAERLAAFMAFLPRRLCIRFNLVRELPQYQSETLFVHILYVGITGTDMAEIRGSLSCDTKVSSLSPASYVAQHASPDKISQSVGLMLRGWENSLNSAVLRWLEPKEFVGAYNFHDSTTFFVEADKASYPRFMLYYGLLASKIDLVVDKLEGVAGMNYKNREDLTALKGLRARFTAFVAQTQRELSSI
jgi:hypothetical protein